jgi:hypothetical protein
MAAGAVWSGALADVRAVTVVEGQVAEDLVAEDLAVAVEDTELTTRARRWLQP